MYNVIMKIVPAILVNNVENFVQQVNKFAPYYQHFAIDIADGLFVPDKTINLSEIALNLSRIESLTALTFDFDLMVKDLTAHLNELVELEKQMKINVIFTHSFESFNPRPNLGIAIDPPIPADTIIQAFELNTLPAIQIMSITPGAQGRAFIPETLQKIEQLRNAGYRNNIYLDGGINNETLHTIFQQQFQPDVLCIGSYLTQAENVDERVKQLNESVANLR